MQLMSFKEIHSLKQVLHSITLVVALSGTVCVNAWSQEPRSELVPDAEPDLAAEHVQAEDVQQEDIQAGVVKAEDAQSSIDVSRELEQRLRAIETMQSELGIYDLALIEAYADLASVYFDIGQYQEAVNLYSQSLQVARIATGLNSEQQLPVIDKLITSTIALNDWQETDDMQTLRLYLKNRLYKPSDPRFIQAIDEMGRWKLRLMKENLMDQNYRNLTNEASSLSDLYGNAIVKIQAAPGYTEQSLLPLYQGKSLADIEIARYLASTPYHYFEGNVSRYISQTVCNNVRDAQGNVVRNCYSVQRENPRYRQSQQDAKRIAVNRSVREVEASIAGLNGILSGNNDMPALQREEVMTQIRELQVEFENITRQSRRGTLF